MRVALVCPYDIDVPGGVQSHVLHQAATLRALGDEVAVIAPGRRTRGGITIVGRSRRIPFNDSVAPIALAPSAARRTRTALRDFRPDVVHVHEPAVPWVSLAALGTDVPTVGTFHAWSDRDRLYRVATPLLRRRLGRLAAHVAVSPAAAAYHAAALEVPERRFTVVPNGVDVNRFARARPFPQMREHPSLLFVGRLEPRKGLEQLLRAFALLKAHRPDLHLYVVGDGPDRDRCQGLLPGRLRSDVVFLGRVDEDELPRFYASCDVFVAPALGGESFGIVLLEAMSARRPVVASDIPGYASVATDGVDARLVPPRDPAALADAIGALLDHPQTAEALARQGQQTARRYDWSEIGRQVRELYAQVLSQSSGGQ